MLLHSCNVFVADPKMLVCDENMAQIHHTARLECFCGEHWLMVRYENFKDIHSATFLWSPPKMLVLDENIENIPQIHSTVWLQCCGCPTAMDWY